MNKKYSSIQPDWEKLKQTSWYKNQIKLQKTLKKIERHMGLDKIFKNSDFKPFNFKPFNFKPFIREIESLQKFAQQSSAFQYPIQEHIKEHIKEYNKISKKLKNLSDMQHQMDIANQKKQNSLLDFLETPKLKKLPKIDWSRLIGTINTINIDKPIKDIPIKDIPIKPRQKKYIISLDLLKIEWLKTIQLNISIHESKPQEIIKIDWPKKTIQIDISIKPSQKKHIISLDLLELQKLNPIPKMKGPKAIKINLSIS